MIMSRFVHSCNTNEKCILVHTLTFDYVVLRHVDREKLLHQEFAQLSTFKKDELIAKLFLISNKEEDSILLSRAIKAFSRKRKYPPISCFYMTNECNLRCKFCFQGEDVKRRKLHVTSHHIDSFLTASQLMRTEYSGEYIENIVLFGGEPLLPANLTHVRYLFERINGLALYGQGIEIVTNGVYLHKYLSVFRRSASNIRLIRVTLAGPSQYHDRLRCTHTNKGTFRTIVTNVNLIATQFPSITIVINILLDRTSIDQMSQLIDELERELILKKSNVRLNLGSIQFRENPFQNTFGNQIDYTEYFPKLLRARSIDKRLLNLGLDGSEVNRLGNIISSWEKGTMALPTFTGCNAVHPGRYCFYPDGYIYPCTEIAGKKGWAIGQYHPKYVLFEDDFERWRQFTVTNQKRCMSCRYIGLCSGGCLVTNQSINSDITNVYCINYKESIDNVLRELDYQGFFNEVS